MKQITINEAMVLQRAIRERVNELKTLRSEVSTKTSWLNVAQGSRVIEPQYDVKLVDRKITELERFLLKTDSAIKVSNAKTSIDLDSDVDKLLESIQ